MFRRKSLTLLYVYTKMLSTVAADRVYRMLKELCYVGTRIKEESQEDFRVIVIIEDIMNDTEILQTEFNYCITFPRI